MYPRHQNDYMQLFCFLELISETPFGGGVLGGGPPKEYELRGGFYPGNWLLVPNQLSHHKLNSSAMTVLLTVLRRKLRVAHHVSTNFPRPFMVSVSPC